MLVNEPSTLWGLDMATAPINLPSIYKNIQAPAGANPQDVQITKDQMAMQFAPQESSITNTLNTIQGYLDRDISAQQQYGQVADQKIAGIGNELAGKLQGNVGAIGDIFQKGGEQVAGAYDEAAQANQASTTSIMDRLKGSAGVLGQDQALKADPYGTDPISRLMASQATTGQRIASGKAGSVANLATLGTSLKGIAQKAVGDSEREYAQKRTDVATQVLKVIGQLQTTAQTGIMEQLQKFSTLAETAGPTFRTLLAQATQSRNKAEHDAAVEAFDQWAKIQTLNQGQQRIDTDRAVAASKINKEDDPNSLDNIYKRLQIEKLGGDIDERDARGTYLSDTEGNAKLQKYINDIRRPDRGSPGISGTAGAGIMNFINQNYGQATMSGLYNTTDPIKILAGIAQQNIDPKTGKVNLPVTGGSKYKQSDYQIDFQTLLDALTQRFGNVGTSAKIGAPIK